MHGTFPYGYIRVYTHESVKLRVLFQPDYLLLQVTDTA